MLPQARLKNERHYLYVDRVFTLARVSLGSSPRRRPNLSSIRSHLSSSGPSLDEARKTGRRPGRRPTLLRRGGKGKGRKKTPPLTLLAVRAASILTGDVARSRCRQAQGRRPLRCCSRQGSYVIASHRIASRRRRVRAPREDDARAIRSRLPEATDSAEKRYRTRDRTES
ncbi:hypothetical protein GW17_00033077 [Ensete ventricosum]|nr:hypothetical protein GW17_00033077 [Ensete ventricosum]